MGGGVEGEENLACAWERVCECRVRDNSGVDDLWKGEFEMETLGERGRERERSMMILMLVFFWQCGMVKFCSSSCQAKAWKAHKKICVKPEWT